MFQLECLKRLVLFLCVCHEEVHSDVNNDLVHKEIISWC